ncbi:MAG: response regulator [Gammaproteobacteria bacterium]|nr:response regulator [Gammaproteobacteria bacterium]
MTKKFDTDKPLTPSETGELLGITPMMVRHLVQQGKIKTTSNEPIKIRIDYSEIEHYARDNDITMMTQCDEELRILIIDDDVQFSHYLNEALECLDKKIDIEVTNDGFQGGILLKTFRPNIILLDLMMPDLNGFDVCNLIKLSPVTRGTRVITMTGYYTQEIMNDIIEAGAEACLPKPIDIDLLLKQIDLERYNL